MTLPAFPKPSRPARDPRQRGGLQRKTRLRARRWGTRRRPTKHAESWREFPAYLAFVRLQDCIVHETVDGATTCRGDVVAAHLVTGRGQKGTSLKADDRQAVPMCCRHHDEFDGRDRRKTTTFYGWSQARRDREAAGWVATMQDRATPRDREQALTLQGLALGVWDEASATWTPGPVRTAPDDAREADVRRELDAHYVALGAAPGTQQIATASGGGGADTDSSARPTIPCEAKGTGGAEVDYAATASPDAAFSAAPVSPGVGPLPPALRSVLDSRDLRDEVARLIADELKDDWEKASKEARAIHSAGAYLVMSAVIEAVNAHLSRTATVAAVAPVAGPLVGDGELFAAVEGAIAEARTKPHGVENYELTAAALHGVDAHLASRALRPAREVAHEAMRTTGHFANSPEDGRYDLLFSVALAAIERDRAGGRR